MFDLQTRVSRVWALAAPFRLDSLRYQAVREAQTKPESLHTTRGNSLTHALVNPGTAIALISFLLTALWAFAIKPFDAPDEPAHLQSIMEVRDYHRLPEIHYDLSTPRGQVIGSPGDEAARNYAIKQGVTNPYNLIPYEAMQPPLYYLASGVAALALPSDPEYVLYLGRLVSALFGAATVYFCWAATRQFAPEKPAWAISVAALVALLPQFCFNSATAANDSALNLAASASFYVWIRSLREVNYDPWMLRAGALIGLGVVSKLTTTALIPGLAVVVAFRIPQSGLGQVPLRETLKRGARLATGASAAAVAVCGWWLIRNLIVYGEVTGSKNAIAFYKGRFDQLDPRMLFASDFFERTWQSTWGRFSWNDLTMPEFFYEQTRYLSVAFLALTFVVAMRYLLRGHKSPDDPSAFRLHAVWAMIVVAIIMVASYLQFSFTVAFGPQGRYLFPLLLPMALLFTGGVNALPTRRLTVLAMGILLSWLAVSNVIGLAVVSSH